MTNKTNRLMQKFIYLLKLGFYILVLAYCLSKVLVYCQFLLMIICGGEMAAIKLGSLFESHFMDEASLAIPFLIFFYAKFTKHISEDLK